MIDIRVAKTENTIASTISIAFEKYSASVKIHDIKKNPTKIKETDMYLK